MAATNLTIPTMTGVWSNTESNSVVPGPGLNHKIPFRTGDAYFYGRVTLANVISDAEYRAYYGSDDVEIQSGTGDGDDIFIASVKARNDPELLKMLVRKVGYFEYTAATGHSRSGALLYSDMQQDSLYQSGTGIDADITIDGTAETITISANKTMIQINTAAMYWATQNMDKVLPCTTEDGVTHSIEFDLILDGGTITGGADLNFATGKDLYIKTGTSLSNVDVNNDIRFEFSANTTFDFIGVNVAGSIWNDAASYTLAVDPDGDSSVGSVGDPGTGVGQTNLLAAVNTLEISSNVTATIRYFPTGSQTPTDSTTGTSLDYQYSVLDAIDIEVLAQGYIPFRATNVTPYNGSYAVTLEADPVYNSSHGLTYTTDYAYDRATKVLTIVANEEGRDLYSALQDEIRTNSALYNTAFLVKAVGPDRIDFTDGMTIDSGDVGFWKGAGMQWYASGDTINPTHKFCSIKSASDSPASAGCWYTQVDGAAPTQLTLVDNRINAVMQYYSDPNHDGSTADGYDYSDHLLFKVFKNGYYQARNDVLDSFGISALEPYEYTILISSESTGLTVGDPGISTDLSITDHSAAPKVVGGKNFSYEVVDGGANDEEAIARQLNYDIALDPSDTIYGFTAFELPDIITDTETMRGYIEETGKTSDPYGFYVSRGGSDHPDFTRFQSDDGTYYNAPVVASINITNLPDDVGGVTRLRIYNVTTDTEIYNDDPAGTSYSDTYTDGDAAYASDGDSIRITFTHLNGSTSFESGRTFVSASSGGISADGDLFIEADSVYASNAIDGSSAAVQAIFDANFTADTIELAADTDFSASQAYAFYCHALTTATGIYDFWGGITAQDTGNYRINTSVVDVYFDNDTTGSVKQTDSARIYRDDGTYPVKDPSTSGYGVQINWQNVVYVQNVGGSALLADERTQLMGLPSASEVRTEIEDNSDYLTTGNFLGLDD